MYFPFLSKRKSVLRSRKSRYVERKSKRGLRIGSRVDGLKISFPLFRGRKRSAESFQKRRGFNIRRRFRFRFRSRKLKLSPQTSARRWHFPNLKSNLKTRWPFNLKLKCRDHKRRHEMIISAPIMNMQHPAHNDESTPLTPLNQQVIPGYQYPFSLAQEKFPEVFYRLHRTENWMDIHSPLPSKPYDPSEHGWSAKDTQTPLPSSPKEILTLVRNHFSEKSAYASTPSNSIFVPGVWRAGKSSKVSLWDNEEDAREEGRRIGDVEIFEVKGEVLREGGSVVFCLEELLGRSSALCWVTRGRYGRVGSGGKGKVRKRGRGWGIGWEREGRREGEGLRGKAYLVVGVIPGTHNLPHPSPIIPTPNTININHAFHTENEEEDVMRMGIARASSCSSVSMYGRENPGTFGEFDFDFGLGQEQEQSRETPLSQTPNLPHTKYSNPHRTTNNPGVFNWTLDNPKANDIQEYEIERDIRRHAQGMKRNSAFRRLEKISEDIRDGRVGNREFVDESVGRDEVGEEEEEEMRGMHGGGMDVEGSREWSCGEDEREREKEKEKDSNSKRRITSTARITRKGTFGERFREKSAVLQDEKRISLRGHSFTSHDFDRNDSDGRGRTERARYIDMGTSVCDRISSEEHILEDNMSVGDIPAVVGAPVVVGRKRGEVCEVLETKDGCDDGPREEGGERKSRGIGMRVRGKKMRREENDFEYESSEKREREEVSFDSRMSSSVGAGNDGENIEEERVLQHGDTKFDIEPPEREKLTQSQTTINSRIPIEYLKSGRPISKKMISKDAARDD